MGDFSKYLLKIVSPLLFLLLIWSALSLFFEPYVLPSPLQIVDMMPQLTGTPFLSHWRLSLFRVFTGALLAFFLGTSFAIAGAALKINRFAESLHTMGQTIPAVIVAIMLVLMVGTGSLVPILLIVIMVTPFVALQTMAGLRCPEPLLKMVIRSSGGSNRELLRDLYIPKLIPIMRSTAILSATMAVKVCILGEFIGSENGIGFLLNVARIYMSMDEVLLYVVVIVLQMFFFQLIIDGLFRLFLQKYFYPG